MKKNAESARIQIRPAVENDFPAILELIRELAAFEKAPHRVHNTVKQMQAEKDYFRALVAQTEQGEIVGMALFYFAYYTWVGKSLYLDDLYVREKWRGRGIGRRLLNRVLQIAEENQCKRVRWQVLRWNKPAIDFYRKIGATLDDEWINCDWEFLE